MSNKMQDFLSWVPLFSGKILFKSWFSTLYWELLPSTFQLWPSFRLFHPSKVNFLPFVLYFVLSQGHIHIFYCPMENFLLGSLCHCYFSLSHLDKMKKKIMIHINLHQIINTSIKCKFLLMLTSVLLYCLLS